MKVAIINTYGIGGAARAAYRLHKALMEEDIDSRMLVQFKSRNNYDDSIYGPSSGFEERYNILRSYLGHFPVKKLYPNKSKTYFSYQHLPFSRLVRRINKINPDIVHLHWICGGMMNIKDFQYIRQPIVWSLHDMYPFTGGCHYDEECGAYKKSCGHCKVLRSQKENDLSRRAFRAKQDVFSGINNMTVIGLSKWMAECARESALFRDKDIVHIPNPLDIELFKPSDDKNQARDLWQLPQNKKLVLFNSPPGDPRKGFSELIACLNKLSVNKQSFELVTLGGGRRARSQDYPFATHYLGWTGNDAKLAALYSAVDVMVCPSLQENLSNSIMESLSCGTPVVGFDIGGNSDLIVHKKNGCLARPFDTDDMAKGVEWILNHNAPDTIRANAREHVVANYANARVARRYADLYKRLLAE